MPGRPKIFVDVETRLSNQIDKDAEALRARYERGGEDAGNAWAEGLDRSSAKIEKIHRKRLDLDEKSAVQQGKLTDLQRQAEAQAASLADKEEHVATVRQQVEESTRRLADAEEKVNSSRSGGLGTTAQQERAERDLVSARQDHQSLLGELSSSERDLDSERSKHITTLERISTTEREVVRTHRDHIDATNDLRNSYRSLGDETRRFDQAFNPGGFLSRNLNAFSAFGSISPSLLAPVGLALDQIANAAVSASQGILLLPAIAVAAGAGLGTLQLATMGLSDAIGDMGDPKKFAKDLAGMAPAAQQVALEFQALKPAFDQVRDATSGVFLAGFPQMINNLATQYAPAIQQLTTGIAGAFNQALTGVGNLLMTPEMQTSIQSIVSSVVSAFQQLAPAVVPMVEAFAKLTEVGAQFLPGLATVAGELATKFNSFIEDAAKSGDLKKWMQEGIDAVKAVGSVVLDVGKMIYEVFGLHSKQDIEEFKNTMHGIITTVGAVLNALQDFFAKLGAIFRAVGDSPIGAVLRRVFDDLGGIGDVLSDLAIAWLAWEVGGRIVGGINGISNALYTLTARLTGVSAAAQTGATGVAAAFSAGGVAATAISAMVAAVVGLELELNRVSNPAFPSGYNPATGRFDTWAPVPQSRPSDLGGLLGAPPGPLRPGQPGFIGPVPMSQQLPFATPTGPDIPPYAGPYPVPAPPAPGTPGGGAAPPVNIPLDQYSLQNIPLGKFPGETPAASAGPTVAGTVSAPSGLAAAAQYVTSIAGSPYGPAAGPTTWDCSGLISDVYAILTGKPYTGSERYFTTLSDFPALGFVPGYDPNSVLNIGVNQGHMAGTLAGVPIESGGPSGGGVTVGQGQGALQGQFTQRFHLPQTTSGMQYGPLQYGSQGNPYQAPGYGYYETDPQKVADAQARLQSAGNSVEEARARYLELKAKSNTTEQELQKAKDTIQERETAYLKAQRELADAQQGTYKKLQDQTQQFSQGMGQIGAALDADLGISKGLPGLADNLVRFLANLAMAPVLGALSGVVAAGGGGQGGKGLAGMAGLAGFGSMGMLASQQPGAGGGGMAMPGGYGGGGAIGQVPGTGPLPGPPMGANWPAIAQAESGGNWGANTGNGYSGGLQFTPSSWAQAGGTQYAPAANLATPGQQMMTANNLLAQQGPGAWPSTFQLAQPGQAIPGAFSPVAPMGVTPAGYGPTTIGGLAPPAGQGKGFSIGGGLIGMAESAAPSAAAGAASIMPGGGAAGAIMSMGAQIGIDEINRAIAYAGQVASIGVAGLEETFLPAGVSELAQNSWISRIVGGLVGARPALPNLAGGLGGGDKDQKGLLPGQKGQKDAGLPGQEGQTPGPLQPGQVAEHGAAAGKPPGPPQVNVNVDNTKAPENLQTAVTPHLQAMYQGTGR